MSDLKAAVLLLEDGTFFEGRSCGADGTSIGEICFNTTAIGYPEVISDPGYKGQIVAMTYPQIGNYGINLDDLQSGKLALSGLVVRDLCQTPSNFRSDMGLSELLINNGVVAIDNIDTRQLVTHIRDKGAMQAIISAEDMDKASLMEKLNNASPLNELDLVEVVSTEETYKFELDESVYGDLIEPGAKPNLNIVVYDLGCKRSVLRGLARAGFNAVVVPSNTSASDILALDVDAVLFSNGPGSPVRASTAIAVASELVGKLPLFGVGLGHQIIALAAGGLVEKLKVGHHGGNYPAVNPADGTVEITAQSHNYSVKFESLGSLDADLSGGITQHPDSLRFWIEKGIAPVVKNAKLGRIQLTHINLNDATVEGLKYLDQNTFSTQFHPGLNPGLIKSNTAYDLIAQILANK